MDDFNTILKEIEETDGTIRKRIKDLAPKLFDLFDKVFYYGNDIEVYLPKEDSNHKFLYVFGSPIDERIICVYEAEEVKKKWWMPADEIKHPVLRLVKKIDETEVTASCSIALVDLLTLEEAITAATKFVSDKVYAQKKTSTAMLDAVERIEDSILGKPDVNENL